MSLLLSLFFFAGAASAQSPVTEAFVAGDCHLCHKVPGRDKPTALPAPYTEIPSLEAAMARLDPEWVRGWLQDPHDLRPLMDEGMPRARLDEATLDTIVGAFAEARATAPASATPDPSRVDEGAKLFMGRGCLACHPVGGRDLIGLPIAPDLANARERLSADVLAAHIADPLSLTPATTMPDMGLTDDEVLAVRDFLWLADLQWVGECTAPAAAVSPTAEPVTWKLVNERVFAPTCAQCHLDPAQNDGQTGPAYGWMRTGVQLQTYEGAVAAADRIADSLSRRRIEAARDVCEVGHRPAALERPELPGMPLGLPPLSDEDTALVLGWIAQGTPK